jgi:hypothetical protein
LQASLGKKQPAAAKGGAGAASNVTSLPDIKARKGAKRAPTAVVAAPTRTRAKK